MLLISNMAVFKHALKFLPRVSVWRGRRMLHNTAAKQGSETGLSNKKHNLKFLSQEQQLHYEENGYIVVENVLEKQEVNEIVKAVDDFIRWSALLNKSTGVYCLSLKHTKERPMLERVICPSLHHPSFASLIRHPRLLDIVEDLIGPSFRYMPQEKLNIKPADGGLAIPWHQDWAFFPHTNDSVLTASILIDDSKKENGCLQVIPGSHKGPLYDHFKDGKFASSIHDENFKPSNPVYLEAPSGSVTIHHVRVAHGSAKNPSKTPRRIACFIYNSADAWPLLGVAGPDFSNIGPVDWELFNSTLVRGQPTEYPRLKDCPVKLPLPLVEPSSVIGDFEDVYSP